MIAGYSGEKATIVTDPGSAFSIGEIAGGTDWTVNGFSGATLFWDSTNNGGCFGYMSFRHGAPDPDRVMTSWSTALFRKGRSNMLYYDGHVAAHTSKEVASVPYEKHPVLNNSSDQQRNVFLAGFRRTHQ